MLYLNGTETTPIRHKQALCCICCLCPFRPLPHDSSLAHSVRLNGCSSRSSQYVQCCTLVSSPLFLYSQYVPIVCVSKTNGCMYSEQIRQFVVRWRRGRIWMNMTGWFGGSKTVVSKKRLKFNQNWFANLSSYLQRKNYLLPVYLVSPLLSSLI